MNNDVVLEEKTSRFVYLDCLRVLATAAVMVLHISAQNWRTLPVDSIMWQSFNFYDSLVRWSVPAFIMISGTLFLSRDDISTGKIYSKYIPRLLFAYFIWNFIYFLSGGNSVSEQFSSLFGSEWAKSVAAIINGHIHMWFIKMIIGIYMCLPVIKQIVKNEKATNCFLTLSLIFYSTVPLLFSLTQDFGGEDVRVLSNTINNFVNGMRTGFVTNLVFYFILGYQLSKTEISKKTRIVIYALGILGAAFTVVANATVSVMNQKPLETYFHATRLNVTVQVVAIFVFFKYSDFKNKTVCKIFHKLSEWSFGAYLVHMLVIELFAKYGFDTLAMPPFVSVPVITVAAFVCSFAVSGVLNCLPPTVRKYIV
ncbi:MAG: acyltransferase family protein [Synergistes sp.]|nr:acyltransferase family protein [Synergistes sp.]